MKYTKDKITAKRLLDLAPRTKLRLSEIERHLRVHRVIIPTPSRSTLIALCEDGTLEATRRITIRKTRRPHWLVYEDSFLRWVAEMDETNQGYCDKS
ncbi:MAG TPA: hypothetical protein PKA82_01795 [Pyrinomonadaceae bacterium]|nr:hypothetical protein [Pyrinomonadaceae bacterium]